VVADGREDRIEWLDSGYALRHLPMHPVRGTKGPHLCLPFSAICDFDQRDEIPIPGKQFEHPRLRRADDLRTLGNNFSVNSLFLTGERSFVGDDLEPASPRGLPDRVGLRRRTANKNGLVNVKTLGDRLELGYRNQRAKRGRRRPCLAGSISQHF
jgi:hypothetical protein